MKLVLLIMSALGIAMSPAQESPFSIASPDRKLSFPKDHGNHPDFKIEWWYITGHLFDDAQRRYGFESTFFRLAQRPDAPPAEVLFDDSHIYMAHMAVTDIEGQTFYHEERFNRQGWNAFSTTGDLDVRNGNWSLKRDPENTLHLKGSIQSKSTFDLQLTPQKPHVIFGENGVSRKGADPSAASHYITWPRLKCAGTLMLGDEELSVSGSAWMDHEISSSQLDKGQTGWDWVSIQFDDGRELMAYMLRLKEGGYSTYSKMVWIDKAGNLVHQKSSEFSWYAEGDWQSPETGANYPISPRFTTMDPESQEQRSFKVMPLLRAQEMTGKIGGVPYWEGACDVVDVKTGKTVGRAYLELAGYVDGLSEKLR